MNKRPAFMFYPADWRKDPALRVCSIAARGLWIDMLCIMHEAEPYGHLLVGTEPVSDDQIARLVGEPVGAIRKLLAQLERHAVFSRTEDGVIFSRRMIHDEHIRNVRAAAGKLGGNPALKDNDKVKQDDKQKPTPSVSVSVSSSVSPKSRLQGVREDAPVGQPTAAIEPPTQNRPDVRFGVHTTQFLRSLRAPHLWAAEFVAMLDQMPGHVACAADQLDQAAMEFVANAEHPNIRVFRGYVRRVVAGERPSAASPASSAPLASGLARAQDLVAQILDLATATAVPGHGVKRAIRNDDVRTRLGPEVFDAFRHVGGAARFLDTPPAQLGLLHRDFATALTHSTREVA